MSVKSGNKQKNRNQVALSALAASLLTVALAPMAYAGNTDYGTDGVNNTGAVGTQDRITFYNWDLAVGSTVTTSTTSPTAGVPIAILPSTYVADTYVVYTVMEDDITSISQTTQTGEVLLEESGNVTGTAGSSTTVTTVWDEAVKRVYCNNTAGCGTFAFNDLISETSGVTGTWDGVTNGTFTEGAPVPGAPVVAAGDGGNLIMTGNGSFGGDLYVNGTIYGGSNATGTPVLGDLTLHGGTASTTVVIGNGGINVTDSTNGNTMYLSNTGNLTIPGQLNSGSISTGNITSGNITNSGNIQTATLNTTGNVSIGGNLDMTNGNISNVNTITATTGNITTINSTTINNSGTFNNGGNANINGNLDVNGTTNLDGAVTMQSTLNVAGATTLNGSTTVNNSFTVDTNGAAANVTGTGRVVVQTNSASFGVQNAGGNLNGITANTTGTVVRGGTNSSTLTLQQDNAVLSSGANSSVTLTTNDAEMYGYTTADITNAYGSYVRVNGNNAYVTGNSNAYVYGYYNAEMYNAYGSGFQAYYDGAYMTGSSEAVVSGGGSSLTLNSDGATFSGEGGSPIRVHGVADGKANHDAVNVSQLRGLREDLSGGIASTIAMTNIPHVDESKTFAVGIGYGNYDGENGYALGGSYRFMGSGVLKASVAGSDSGETAWGVGAGMSW